MKMMGKWLVLLELLWLLGGCIPDNLDDCPLPPEKNKDNVDITVDMDTDIDTGEQETEMP